MASFTRSVDVGRPIEEVFDFATDLANASVLLPTVTRAEMLTDGPMRPGSRFRETRSVNGKERAAVIEVVAHERPQVHAARAGMLGMRATYTFRFSPCSVGTHVELRADVEGNLLWKPFLGMLSRMMEKEDGAYLDRLKAALEKA